MILAAWMKLDSSRRRGTDAHKGASGEIERTDGMCSCRRVSVAGHSKTACAMSSGEESHRPQITVEPGAEFQEGWAAK